MRRLLTITMLTTTSLIGFAAPGDAAAAGTLSTADGVLYEDCEAHPYSFAISPPAGTDSWSMNVTAYGPDGTPGESDVVDTGVGTGSGAVEFCGDEKPGQYQLVADVEYTDLEASVPTTTERLATTFAMRQPKSRTSLRVSTLRPRLNSEVRFSVTALEERAAGYLPASYAKVRLQKRVDSKWVKVRKGKSFTNARGRVVFTLRWNVAGRVAVRAETVTSPAADGSVSRSVKLRTH